MQNNLKRCKKKKNHKERSGKTFRIEKLVYTKKENRIGKLVKQDV